MLISMTVLRSLLRLYLHDPIEYTGVRDCWVTRANFIIDNLLSRPYDRPDLSTAAFLAQRRNSMTIFVTGHQTCSIGADLISGGLVFQNATSQNAGLALIEGCIGLHTRSPTNIGPQSVAWFPWLEQKEQIWFPDIEPAEFRWENIQPSIQTLDGRYSLSGEVFKGLYFAYRATHDPYYQDMAWRVFVAINGTCRDDVGSHGLSDVDVPGGGGKINQMPGHFMAETLKFAYLVQGKDVSRHYKGFVY